MHVFVCELEIHTQRGVLGILHRCAVRDKSLNNSDSTHTASWMVNAEVHDRRSEACVLIHVAMLRFAMLRGTGTPDR